QHSPLPSTPERLGMLTMLVLVAVFGVHSLVDWTWYVPGDACVALLCAGWLAGRGELRDPTGEGRADVSASRELRFSLPRVGLVRADARSSAIAAVVVLGALLAAWAQWQPQRSVDASQHALALLARDPAA